MALTLAPMSTLVVSHGVCRPETSLPPKPLVAIVASVLARCLHAAVPASSGDTNSPPRRSRCPSHHSNAKNANANVHVDDNVNANANTNTNTSANTITPALTVTLNDNADTNADTSANTNANPSTRTLSSTSPQKRPLPLLSNSRPVSF